MKIATQNKPFFSDNLKEKLSFIKELGFDAYEVDGDVVLDRFQELKNAYEKTGLTISTCCGGYGGWIGDFDESRRKKGVEDITKILELGSTIGIKGIVVPAAWGMFTYRLPPMIPRRTVEEDRVAIFKSLDVLNNVGKNTNTFIYLEPLNRYEDHMINTVSTAREIIDEKKYSNVLITADFFHMNIEELKIPETILEHKDYIGHIHIADSHRFEPPAGHMDFSSGFKALKEIGYDDYFAFEFRVTEGNEVTKYKKSLEYIRECYNNA